MGRCGEAYLIGVDNILGIGQHQKLKLQVWINSNDPTRKKKNQPKKQVGQNVGLGSALFKVSKKDTYSVRQGIWICRTGTEVKSPAFK